MKDKIMATIYTVLGTLIAFGPTYLFKVCQGLKADGTPMKCHWMAQSELGIGLVIILVGILLFLVKINREAYWFKNNRNFFLNFLKNTIVYVIITYAKCLLS